MSVAQVSLRSPFGDLTLFEQDRAIVALEWGRAGTQSPTALLERAAAGLQDYFDTGRLPADLPLNPRGSPYQRRVWAALREIPDGETRTYRQIAARAGGSARSVGGANSRNPIPILIPCHRVVAATGLGGYTGADGLSTKRALLALEDAHACNQRSAFNHRAA
jgi:methylated-DNA-[protein]-cysteine S-methyltransferase